MFGPTRKYRDAKVDANGVPLFWDGHPEGFPMRGERDPMLKADEVANAELVFHDNYRYFELPKDQAAYLAVKDQITNGLGMVTRELTTPDPANPAVMHVHLWWVMFEAVRGRPGGPPEAPAGVPSSYLPFPRL
jgi:hypothetical protein